MLHIKDLQVGDSFTIQSHSSKGNSTVHKGILRSYQGMNKYGVEVEEWGLMSLHGDTSINQLIK